MGTLDRIWQYHYITALTKDEPPLKPVIWIGSSRNDLRTFPDPVQDHICYALYVLHAFQKKSKTGRETPKRDIALVKLRLREAEQIARERKP